MSIPQICRPDESDQFHDSSLIEFSVSPHLDTIRIVVSTPDENHIERLWLIECKGVLRLEYETLGDGSNDSYGVPLEIYDIYNDISSDERQRWATRLKDLGVEADESGGLWNIVLGSSFMRGWGDRENLEGVNIICRTVTILQAPEKYRGSEYRRPRIKADS